VNILDRDRRIIHQDANGQCRPPSVMMLIVSPKALRRMIEVKMERGIEIAMISVLRQLPRNRRIMTPVRPGGKTLSATSKSAAETNPLGLRAADFRSRRGVHRACLLVLDSPVSEVGAAR